MKKWRPSDDNWHMYLIKSHFFFRIMRKKWCCTVFFPKFFIVDHHCQAANIWLKWVSVYKILRKCGHQIKCLPNFKYKYFVEAMHNAFVQLMGYVRECLLKQLLTVATTAAIIVMGRLVVESFANCVCFIAMNRMQWFFFFFHNTECVICDVSND